MFNTLRSRLWLTYALLIGLVLSVVGAAIFSVVYRGNLPLQQAAINLQSLRVSALPRLREAANVTPEGLQGMLTRNASQIQGRIVVLNRSGQVLADSLINQDASLPDFSTMPLQTEVGALPGFYRDSNERLWYYLIDSIDENRVAFFAVSRPRLQIVTIFRDQYLGPLVQSGLFSMLVAFVISLLMSRWITAPLRRIGKEARQVADGRARPIPMTGPEEVQQLAASFNDMNQQVQETQQSQKDFIANVSHDLKTPLTSIQGFARALQDGTAQSKAELAQAASVIQSESERMHRLIQALLTLTKMDAGMADFNMRSMDITPLLQAAQHNFTPRAEAMGIQFTTTFTGLPVQIMGDPDRLMQVLDNLLDNALKFTEAGGRVTLSSQAVEDELQIHVVDTGQGIPPEEQKRIFERFYQVDKARPGGEVRGYGLGLSISQQIVAAHGGTLTLTSQPGEGSHFVVKIPLQND